MTNLVGNARGFDAVVHMSQKVPNVFIHIGHGKTGTTAIQDMFFLNRAEFLRNGVLYPSVGIPQQAHGLLQSGHHLLCNDLQVPFDQYQRGYVNRIFASLRAEIESASPDIVFISSELLCYAEPELPHLLSTKLANFNVKIIYVVRRQDYLIPSAYLQAAKEGRADGRCTLQEYFDRYSYAFDFIDRIGPWREAFGASSINCILAQDGLNLDMREVILEVISCSLAPEKLIVGRRNRSLGFGFLAFFRILASFGISSEMRWKILEALERIPGITASSEISFNEIFDACRKRFLQSNTEFAREYLSDEQANYFCFDSN